MLLGWGAGIRALPTTCSRSPCTSKISGKPRRPLVGGGALPERNVSVGWNREEEPGQENYRNLLLVREDPSLHNPICLHRVKECMGALGRELQQAVVSWCYLVTARSSMHTVWVLGLRVNLEARVLKRKPRHHTASGGTSHARRATGLAETAGTGQSVSSESARSSRNVPKL